MVVKTRQCPVRCYLWIVMDEWKYVIIFHPVAQGETEARETAKAYFKTCLDIFASQNRPKGESPLHL